MFSLPLYWFSHLSCLCYTDILNWRPYMLFWRNSLKSLNSIWGWSYMPWFSAWHVFIVFLVSNMYLVLPLKQDILARASDQKGAQSAVGWSFSISFAYLLFCLLSNEIQAASSSGFLCRECGMIDEHNSLYTTGSCVVFWMSCQFMLFDIVSLVCDSYQAEVFLERGFRQEVFWI